MVREDSFTQIGKGVCSQIEKNSVNFAEQLPIYKELPPGYRGEVTILAGGTLSELVGVFCPRVFLFVQDLPG